MSAIEIKRDYPLAFAKLVEYFASKMGNQLNLDKLPDEVKSQFSPEMVAGMAINMVAQRSALYSFMDENSIFLTLHHTTNKWDYMINDITYVVGRNNRTDCEEMGFEECFKILNSKLS